MPLLSEGQVTHASLITQCNSGQCSLSDSRQTRLICEEGHKKTVKICVYYGMLLAYLMVQQKTESLLSAHFFNGDPDNATAIHGWDSKMTKLTMLSGSLTRSGFRQP